MLASDMWSHAAVLQLLKTVNFVSVFISVRVLFYWCTVKYSTGVALQRVLSSAHNDYLRFILTCLIFSCVIGRIGKIIKLYFLYQFPKACWRISLMNMAIHLLLRGKTTCCSFLCFQVNFKKTIFLLQA